MPRSISVSRRSEISLFFDFLQRISVTSYIAANILAGENRPLGDSQFAGQSDVILQIYVVMKLIASEPTNRFPLKVFQ